MGEDTRPIEAILIGPRLRQDIGDIDELAANIAELGLIQPITITLDNRLIAGYRRILAYKRLGRSDIPVRVLKEP